MGPKCQDRQINRMEPLSVGFIFWVCPTRPWLNFLVCSNVRLGSKRDPPYWLSCLQNDCTSTDMNVFKRLNSLSLSLYCFCDFSLYFSLLSPTTAWVPYSTPNQPYHRTLTDASIFYLLIYVFQSPSLVDIYKKPQTQNVHYCQPADVFAPIFKKNKG